jgi:plasmid stabilization system protein ParE
VRLQWTEPATRDLNEIAGFYEREASPVVAAENILRILDTVKKLLEAPHQSRPGRIPHTRELVLTTLPFVVPYRVKGNTIQILRVFHTARQLPKRW